MNEIQLRMMELSCNGYYCNQILPDNKAANRRGVRH